MAPDPRAITVHFDRLTETITGLPLVGVGGHLPAGDPAVRVEVRADGQPTSAADPTPRDLDGVPVRHFAVQFPAEPTTTLSVHAIDPAGERVLAETPLAAVGDLPAPPPVERGLLGVARRGARSVVTGEVLSPARWQARAGRFAEFLLRGRQKVAHKLAARRFRPCDPHATFAAGTAITPRLRAAMATAAAGFRYRPTISILTPVHNVDPKWLAEAIASVRDQVYDRWELCLADDASTNPETRAYLDKLPGDPRIKLVRRPANGHICAATNSAADLATGEFVALLDNDDALAPHALFEVASLLQRHPDADLIYSDEDKIDEAGRRFDPQFKPDWSPDLLLSYNYVNHFTVIRRAAFERAGRFRVGYEGSQDHDLLLRVTDRTDKVHHIPHILYHWRALPTSTAATAGVKGYVHTSGRRAVADALARRGEALTPHVPPVAERLNLPILGLDGPDDGPAVAVVIHGPAVAAAKTVRAIKTTTDYKRYTNYLVTDGPPADALNRLCAGRTEDLLVFLEAGVEPADPRWLSRLVAHVTRPGVGAAGGLFRTADGTIASAGTVLGLRDGIAPGHAFAGLPADAVSYYFLAEVARTVSAPGRGCLATPRAAFDRVGGFDADRFPNTLFDVDYCLRLAGQGLRAVHVGGAELRTPTAADRVDDPIELRAFKLAHGRPADPFYNPNLSAKTAFRPVADGPLVLPAEAKAPAVRTLVAAHNLSGTEGAPRYLAEIVVGLAARGGIAPEVVCPVGGAGEAAYTSAAIPVSVADQPWAPRFVDGRWTPREYQACQHHLARLFAARRPELVLANTMLTSPVVDAAARAGVPSVWVIHESYDPAALGRLFPPFTLGRLEAAFAAATRVVPASHATAALYQRWNVRGNVTVLHNGIDPAPLDAYAKRVSKLDAATLIGGTPGVKRVVAVGTICERKGQHTLVEAAAILANERTDFAVDLVGLRPDITYSQHVRALVRRHGLERVVNLIPETDATPYFRAADVFACTSHIETYSRAVLEAEAFGLPVVSTRCCGLDEQVWWGHNALPFEFGDAAGLAACLRTVLGDDTRRAAMAAKSRAAFDTHLTYPEMLDRYEAVLLGAARTGPRGRTSAPPLRKAG